MSRPLLGAFGAVLAIGLAAPAARADADGVQAALRLYREGALSESMDAFEHALAAGGNDRATLGTVLLHLGILRAGARDPDGATRAFERLLALDAAASLPAGSSPLVREPFARARERRGEGPVLGVDVRVPARVRSGRTVDVVVEVHGDPGDLAREARASAAPGTSASATGAPPFRLTLPASATAHAGPLSLRITLHDEYGSTLDEAQASTVVEVSPAAHAPPPAAAVPHEDGPHVDRVARGGEEEDRGGSVLASPWFWGGTAVVVAGGVVAALLLTAGDGQAHFEPVEVRR